MLAPMAMAVGTRARIPPFLMAIMVGNGAQSGALSPFAPTGIIVNGLMTRIGLPGYEFRTYAANLAAHATVAFVGYFALGGWKLFQSEYAGSGLAPAAPTGGGPPDGAFTTANWITIGVILAVMGAVVLLGANIGMEIGRAHV